MDGANDDGGAVLVRHEARAQLHCLRRRQGAARENECAKRKTFNAHGSASTHLRAIRLKCQRSPAAIGIGAAMVNETLTARAKRPFSAGEGSVLPPPAHSS